LARNFFNDPFDPVLLSTRTTLFRAFSPDVPVVVMLAVPAVSSARARRGVVNGPYLEMRSGPGSGYPVFSCSGGTRAGRYVSGARIRFQAFGRSRACQAAPRNANMLRTSLGPWHHVLSSISATAPASRRTIFGGYLSGVSTAAQDAVSRTLRTHQLQLAVEAVGGTILRQVLEWRYR